MTFHCQTRDAITAEFFVNDTHLDLSNSIRSFIVDYNLVEHGVWNNTVTTTATLSNNNTRVLCVATGNIGNQRVIESLVITIASKQNISKEV